MSGRRRRVWRTILGGFVFVVCLVAAFIWLIMRPRLATASIDDLRKYIPADVLVREPDDKAAQDRFDRLVSPLAATNAYGLAMLTDTSVKKQDRLDAAKDLAQGRLIPRMKAILNEGPIQRINVPEQPPRPSSTTPNLTVTSPTRSTARPRGRMKAWERSQFRPLSRACCDAAAILIESGDAEGGFRLISFNIELIKSLQGQYASQEDYADVPDLGYLWETVGYAASERKFPVAYCKALLDQLPVGTTTDDDLIGMVRHDFQNLTLRIMTNPSAWKNEHPYTDVPYTVSYVRRLPDAIVGEYNAEESAKAVGDQVAALLQNARLPASKADLKVDKIAMNAYKRLPQRYWGTAPIEVANTINQWNLLQAVSKTPKLIQAYLMARLHFYWTLFDASYMARAQLNASRVLLASRLYRAEHGDALPADKTGFLPYLKAGWPIDPYNGEPMIYNPAKQVVYSVGQNQKDDGGLVGHFPIFGSDAGKSLRLYPR